MSSPVQITVHPSQFPDQVQRDLADSLRSRRVNHKFHYDSYKQTRKWLALHDAYSPSRTDADCAAIYDKSFAAVASSFQAPAKAGDLKPGPVHIVGLGCGGGQKDCRLLKLLRDSGHEVFYTPCDVSTAMVMVAQKTAAQVIPLENCFPLVCDLATTEDLAAIIGQASRVPLCEKGRPEVFPLADARGPVGRRGGSLAHARGSARRSGETPALLITFFGMLPNFESNLILPKLSSLVRPSDRLLLSANLAPGPDYLAGMNKVLPLYDNALTRDWLMTFLLDLGVEKQDGDLRFVIEDDTEGTGLKRIAAYFHFRRPRKIDLDSDCFEFHASDSIRLFFSYRHTPALVRELLSPYRLNVEQEWVTASGEEGVFLVTCRVSENRLAPKAFEDGRCMPIA